MVSFFTADSTLETAFPQKTRMDGVLSPPAVAEAPPPPPPAAALTPVQQSHKVRQRKQKLMSKLSDSGFEEDWVPSLSPPIETDVIQGSDKPGPQVSTWYLHYGDICFGIERKKEAQFYPCRSLDRQPQLTAEARCKLVSWLIPVHKQFQLSFECCCLTVNIMDRFLASTPVAPDCFQLLGVTALLIASKHVDVHSPRISHLLSLCCDAFNKEQLCNLECMIILHLNYCLAAPTMAFFLDYYTNCIRASQHVFAGHDCFVRINPNTKIPKQLGTFAQKVCELSLADYAFNKYPPSLTAMCALKLESELEEHADSHSFREGLVDELCVQVKFQESYDPGLVQECKDNLKLLVSLNQQSLEVMSNI